MKISKLFHWLYAFVMCLPILAIGFTCLYAVFNKNANKSFDNIKETQLINLDEFKYLDTYNYHITSDIQGNVTEQQSKVFATNFLFNGTSYDNVQFWYYGSGGNILLFAKDMTNNVMIIENGRLYQYVFSFDYLRSTFTEEAFNIVKPSLFKYDELKLSNVFYYSVDRVKDAPMFNWAYNSFLVAPFTYVMALFGVPSTHIIVELLSYWLAISIIWLVFDMIMYLPLLFHRWLDKGVIE